MRERPALFLGLLADQPELIAEVGVLRWCASGTGGTPGPWIESTARDAGRDSLPVTLVAMDLEGSVIGAVTLEPGAEEPWVSRMVVRPGERLCGVGRLMMTALEDLARAHGYCRLRVAVDAEDAEQGEFYRHCGWDDVDPSSGDRMVLAKALAS